MKKNCAYILPMTLHIFCLLFAVGCASFKSINAKKHFVFEKSWVRHTVSGDYYLGARINHVAEPILFSDLIIQGNELDGIVAYNKTTGQIKWKHYITGGVPSSARLFNGYLFFGGGDGFFYSINATTGATKWSFPLRAEGIGTPLVTEDVVYFLAGNNSAYALKTLTGEQVWFYSRPDPADITVRGASEPTLKGKYLYLGFSDGALVAIDKEKGSLLWEKQLAQSVRFHDVDSKPIIDGDRIYVSSYDGQLYCLNLSNGQTIWVNDEGGFTPVTVSDNSPNIIFYSSSTRKVLALEKTSGKVIWATDLKKTIAGSPTLYRGLVLIGEWSGSLRALDQLTGESVAFFETGRGVTAKPIVDESTQSVFVMTADANLFALKLDFKTKHTRLPWEIE